MENVNWNNFSNVTFYKENKCIWASKEYKTPLFNPNPNQMQKLTINERTTKLNALYINKTSSLSSFSVLQAKLWLKKGQNGVCFLEAIENIR